MAAGTVVVALVAAWTVFFSPAFAAEGVTVSGTQDVTPGQVQEAAGVPIGRPLLRVDLQQVARQAAGLPQVASVEVTRDWPRTVHVAVVERRPLLAVAQPDGYLMVDRTGVAFETRPVVPDDVVNADVNPDNQPLLTEVGTAVEALPPALRDQVRRVTASSADHLVMTLDSGLVVTWGNAEESPLKAEVVAALLEREPRVSIDVSSPHNPAVR